MIDPYSREEAPTLSEQLKDCRGRAEKLKAKLTKARTQRNDAVHARKFQAHMKSACKELLVEAEKERDDLRATVEDLETELREWQCETNPTGRCPGCPDCQPIGGTRESTKARNELDRLRAERKK